jgi:hypothetical protein
VARRNAAGEGTRPRMEMHAFVFKVLLTSSGIAGVVGTC